MRFKEKYIECEQADNSRSPKIFVRDWGNSSAPVILAIHGLGGQGENFSPLAERLSEDFRVICPDMPGRGKSSWAENSEKEYCFSSYMRILECLLDKLNVSGKFDWLGTSMGGALGMYCLGHSFGARIRNIVVNDVGYRIDHYVLDEIENAVGNPPVFENLSEAAEYLQDFLGSISCRQGDIKHWQDMAQKSCRKDDNSRYVLHYDPRITDQIKYHVSDYDNRTAFARMGIPMLLIWGKRSTVLTPKIIQEMRGSNEDMMQVKEYKDWGHAPFLDQQSDYDLINRFFNKDKK